MARLVTTSLATAGHQVSQGEMRKSIGRWIAGKVRNEQRILNLFDRSGVDSRFLLVPMKDLFEPRSLGDRNRQYTEESVGLGLRVSREALASAGVEPSSVGLIVSVSCTGFMTPSVDAYLANQLPLNSDVRRLPITELGCAAGAMALSHAADYLIAYPQQSALVVAVEFPSLNFQPTDFSMDHLVACALFGDGAAASVLVGEQSGHAPRAPRFAHRKTCFMNDTVEAMGFRLEETGFHMVLDVSIPALLEAELPRALRDFLGDVDLTLDDVEHVLVHPGGRKILDFVERMVGRGEMTYARRVLARYGNLSSVSIMALLHEFERDNVAAPGDRAVLIAFGPGFNAELILLEWPRC